VLAKILNNNVNNVKITFNTYNNLVQQICYKIKQLPNNNYNNFNS